MRQGTAFGVGALVAGILASVCCLGPAVLGALGLGTVALGAGLDKFRPVLAVVTVGLLAAAFYTVYRRREVVCEDGSCRMESAGRATKIGLWIVTVLAAGAFAFPYLRPARGGGPARGPGEREVRLAVSGMTCAGCGAGLEKALKALPGVQAVSVDYPSGTARVLCTPGQATPEQCAETVKKAGFGAAVIQ